MKEKSEKEQRYNRIALAAMKQCRRSVLPAIESLVLFDSFCKSCQEFSPKLMANKQEGEQYLDDIINKP